MQKRLIALSRLFLIVRPVRILITGGAGFIGSAVVRMAIAKGHTILNIDKLTYAANLQNLNEIKEHQNYSFMRADICDAKSLNDIFASYKPDAVLHLAAETHVDRSIDGPDAFIKTNIVGTYNLLIAARYYFEKLPKEIKEKFRFHHVSTDEVYGDLDIDDYPFEEITAYDPSSPYSASKAASDHLVRAWGRTYGLPVLITNCSNNYGPYQFPEKLIPVVILKALNEEPIPVYGSGNNIRDWLYVDDHADALLTVLEKGKVGNTYNIGGNNERTNLELVQTICELMDIKFPNRKDSYKDLITFVADRPGHDKRYAINASKIKTELGWTPSISWNDGFEKTIRWYLKNEAWWRPMLQAGKVGKRLGTQVS